VAGPNRRIRVDELCGGGWVEARSHPGVLLVSVAQSSMDRSRRPRVLSTRCIALPQKQVGSARFDSEPIIRKRICVPQNRFEHSHCSSRLFFTNATSARLNAPHRWTCSSRAPSPCLVLPTEGGCVHQNGSLPIIWLSVNSVPQKRCSPLTITTAPPAVGFHPKFPVWCGVGVRPVSGDVCSHFSALPRTLFSHAAAGIELCFDWKNSPI
jgi:hypothetical protein